MSGAEGGPIRVLVVDDDPLVRSALRRMLAETEDIDVVGEADDGDAVPAAVVQHTPDVVLMDLRMRRVDGVAATATLRADPKAPRVLVLTTFESPEDIRAALRAGAAGYLVKDAAPESIEAAIREVDAGHPALAPRVARRLMEIVSAQPEGDTDESSSRARERLGCLTAQERTIAAAVANGHSNARIAKELHLGVSTVKTHISRAMSKLDLENAPSWPCSYTSSPIHRDHHEVGASRGAPMRRRPGPIGVCPVGSGCRTARPELRPGPGRPRPRGERQTNVWRRRVRR